MSGNFVHVDFSVGGIISKNKIVRVAYVVHAWAILVCIDIECKITV